jgi:hypothetical protein
MTYEPLSFWKGACARGERKVLTFLLGSPILGAMLS